MKHLTRVKKAVSAYEKLSLCAEDNHAYYPSLDYLKECVSNDIHSLLSQQPELKQAREFQDTLNKAYNLNLIKGWEI